MPRVGLVYCDNARGILILTVGGMCSACLHAVFEFVGTHCHDDREVGVVVALYFELDVAREGGCRICGEDVGCGIIQSGAVGGGNDKG